MLLFSRFYLCCAANLSAQALWNNTTFVHRHNQQILDGQNNVIRLDGVNLGGWLMWEGWIWGGGFTAEKTISNNLQSVVGTPAANAFKTAVYQNFITRKDIRKISQQCFNVVRIPFNHKLLEDDFTPYVYKPEGWAVLDSVLQWCEDYHVYAVLDLHSAPGGQSISFTSDPDFLITLWNGAINQNRTKRLWKAIAARYKDRGIIAGYDLLNEPDVASDSNMVQQYRGIIDSVRSVDQNHLLFIEGNHYAVDFDMYTALPDPNVCFQFHFYTWFFGNTIAEHLQTYTQLSDALNVPVWCGEWGENNAAQLSTTLDLLNDPAYKVSGNAFWTWKKMKIAGANPYYNGIDSTLYWNKTIKWISNTNLPAPTVVEMQTGMNEFINQIKLENCTFNTSVADILNDCVASGTDEPPANDRAMVYPNPFSNRLTVKNVAQNVDYALINASGQAVWAGNRIEEQDFSGLAKGLYFLKINTSTCLQILKIIKQ